GQPSVSPRHNAIALLAGSSTIPTRVITYTLADEPLPATLTPTADTPTMSVLVDEADRAGERIYQRSGGERLLPEQLAVAEPINWAGHDGETVYGLYYPPTNPDFEG